MKKLFFLLLILNVFIACKSNNKVTVQAPIVETLLSPSERLIERFKPFINGVWVKRNYIEDLMTTKSPCKSFSKLKGVASIEINMDSVKADSLSAGISWNNHEGGAFTILFKTGQTANALATHLIDYEDKTSFYDLGYRIGNNDTSLILYHYNKHAHIIDSVKYTKVLNKLPLNDMGTGIAYIANKILITGKYAVTDSTGTNLKAGFSNEGAVTGFSDFKTYSINTDFEAGPENNLDELDFDANTKRQIVYAVKFNRDTVSLFQMNHNSDSTLLVVGRLKYKLVRQK